MIEVQIKTPSPPNCQMSWIKKVIDSAIVKVENISAFDENLRSLIDVKAKEVEKAIKSLPPACTAILLSRDEAKVLVRNHSCDVAINILKAGCLITSADVRDEYVLWNLICDEDSFVKLVRRLEESGVDFEITYKGNINEKDRVTYREEEILRIALKEGYFDYPKKIKLEELAEMLSIAPSTLSEILRRGQKKVLEKYFGNY